jgi:hypothetical protein
VATLSSGALDVISEVEVITPLAWVSKYDMADKPGARVGDGSLVKFGAIVGLAFIGGFGMSESDV